MMWVSSRSMRSPAGPAVQSLSRDLYMYICICNAVTETSIRQAVRDGARNIFDLIGRTGCSTQCGRCSDLATEILEDELATFGASAGARQPVRLRVVSNA